MPPKKFFLCVPLKVGAWIMAFVNLMFASVAIGGGTIELFKPRKDEEEEEILIYLIMCVIIGVFNLFIGVILLAAILTGKERYVLLYSLFEMTNLMMITIFAAINMFSYQSIYLTLLFIISLILWYGLYCIYGYYVELAEYNSVKSGVIEISCNTNINPLMILPEKAIESTAV